MTRTTFRERLGALQEASGLAGTEISRAAGLSAGAVNHFLSGRRASPDANSLLALARVFGVSVDYLLAGGEEPSAEAVRRATARAKALVDIDPNAIADDTAPLAAVG